MYRGWNKQLFHGYMESSEFNCPKGNFMEKPQESDVWGPAKPEGLSRPELENLFEAQVRRQYFSEAFPLLWGNSFDSLKGMK